MRYSSEFEKERFQYILARFYGPDKQSDYDTRTPPAIYVRPCYVRCLHCNTSIDINFRWIENSNVFDIDCPYCWKLCTFDSERGYSKILSFKVRCWNYFDPPSNKGRKISPSLRFEILHRSDFKRVYCGKPASEGQIHVDHIISIFDGGTNDVDNLAAACSECNLGKGRRSVDR